MTEEYTTGAEIPESTTEAEEANAREAWNEVMRALDDLGKAVSQWANAVRDDPENRRRARKVQDQLEDVGKQIGGTVDRAAQSDIAQQVGAAAVAAGDIAVGSVRRVGDEVGPHLANAFRSLADVIRGAADKVDHPVTEPKETEIVTVELAEDEQPSPAPAPYTGEEPPAPAPHGTPQHRGEPGDL